MHKIFKILRLILFTAFIFMPQNIFCEQTWITIFVHGIVKPPITIQDLYRITKDKIAHTKYANSVEYLRESPDTFTYQPMQELGLKQIDLFDNTPGNSATAIAQLYELQSPKDINNLYYTFGWSALLSSSIRQQEGFNLLIALENELKKLNIKNPHIRFVGYSHGGNVVLNMAKFLPVDDLPFIIDEIILIGTPIQKETDYLINHPVFKNVYNIYSMADIAQKVDKFSTKYFFSHRKFWPRNNFELPEKLTQIEVKVVKIYFNTCEKVKQKKILGPKHSELWQFGWAPKAYRKKFPITPLSISSLIPSILQAIKNIPALSDNLTVTINTYDEWIIIKDNKTKIKYKSDFCQDYFKELKDLAANFKIDYPYCDYAELVKNSMIYALEQRREYKRECKVNK